MARLAEKMNWQYVLHKESGKRVRVNPLIFNSQERMMQLGYEKLDKQPEPQTPPATVVGAKIASETRTPKKKKRKYTKRSDRWNKKDETKVEAKTPETDLTDGAQKVSTTELQTSENQ